MKPQMICPAGAGAGAAAFPATTQCRQGPDVPDRRIKAIINGAAGSIPAAAVEGKPP